MDSIFQLDGASRAIFLQNLVHSFNCTYICLWSYLPPPSNLLVFMDGFYNEAVNPNQPSTSSGLSLSQRLFDEYSHSFFLIQNDSRVPGLALKNNMPFMELNELELQRLASVEAQLQFYQEARIKAAIFMGCNSGEIELGMSSDSKVNLEMELKNIFPQDFSRQVAPMRNLPLPIDQNPPSSSSSSMRSLSLDSSDVSPYLYFNIPKTTSEEQTLTRPASTSTSVSPIQQAMMSLNQIRSPPFPSPEIEEAAMTNAILAVLSSSSPSPSSSKSSHQPPKTPLSRKPSAFKRYQPNLPLPSRRDRHRKQSILKRTIIFFRALSLMRSHDHMQANRSAATTTTQLHHMISERKRREKLNDSFQMLRSLLPPGTKKDKASVLSGSTEYLKSLKSQVIELTRKNQLLEAQILPKKEAKEEDNVSSNETLSVRVRNVAESTSAARIVDLEVILRGECNMLDLVIRILEFLRLANNVTLVNIDADTRIMDLNSINQANFRLRIEDDDWDESAFVEAVKRVVADLAQ